MHNSIVIKGAREHNLKNIDAMIPRDRLVVITGLSGSGKSSLAFDTIYAERQRRYASASVSRTTEGERRWLPIMADQIQRMWNASVTRTSITRP